MILLALSHSRWTTEVVQVTFVILLPHILLPYYRENSKKVHSEVMQIALIAYDAACVTTLQVN